MMVRAQIAAYLRGHWPWGAVFLCVGILGGLVVRVPLLPEPGVFTTAVWAAVAGSGIAAALTIVGTLHIALKLKQQEWEASAQAIVDASSRLQLNLAAIEDFVLPNFPKLADGSYDLDRRTAVPNEKWREVRAAFASASDESEALLRDIELYKGGTIGLDRRRRLAARAMDQTVRDISGSLAEMRDFAARARNANQVLTIKATSLEMIRRSRLKFKDQCDQLLGN